MKVKTVNTNMMHCRQCFLSELPYTSTFPESRATVEIGPTPTRNFYYSINADLYCIYNNIFGSIESQIPYKLNTV